MMKVNETEFKQSLNSRQHMSYLYIAYCECRWFYADHRVLRKKEPTIFFQTIWSLLHRIEHKQLCVVVCALGKAVLTLVEICNSTSPLRVQFFSVIRLELLCDKKTREKPAGNPVQQAVRPSTDNFLCGKMGLFSLNTHSNARDSKKQTNKLLCTPVTAVAS